LVTPLTAVIVVRAPADMARMSRKCQSSATYAPLWISFLILCVLPGRHFSCQNKAQDFVDLSCIDVSHELDSREILLIASTCEHSKKKERKR
jgi:hypothetical protein